MSSQARQSGFPVNGKAGWGSDRQPAWRGGADQSWWHPGALAALDFVNGRALRRPAEVALTSACDCARAGTGYARDASGVWQSFASNTLACIGGIGAGLHGSFANKIRNPRGEGGVVGTVGVTNKCTGYNATGATTGISKSGNASATLATVSDTAALQAIATNDPFIAAGLANGFLTGNVLEIDNTVGAGNVDITCTGAIGATGAASVQVYVRGVTAAGGGIIGLNDASITSAFSYTTSYVRRTASGTTGSSGAVFFLRVPFGIKARVLLFQIEASASAAPVPTVVAGAAATGALPTHWSYEDLTTGLKCSFLGVNTEGGVPYADVRISGTSAATTNVMRVRFDQSTNATAAAGQAWGLDFGGKLLSGVSPNVYARLTAFNSSSSLSDGASGTSTPLTSSKVHRTAKAVIADGTTNNVRGALYMDVTSGNAYDFTFRIYAPKLVQVAVVTGTPNTAGYLPTFPILPAAGVIADSTKLADDVRAANLDWFTAAGLSTGATELAAVTFSHVGDGVNRPLFEYSDGTANNYIRGYVNAADHVALKIVAGGVTQTDTALTASISAANKAYGFGWSATGGYVTNGAETVTFGAVALPVGLSVKRLGGSLSANSLNDILRQVQTCVPTNAANAAAWAQAA